MIHPSWIQAHMKLIGVASNIERLHGKIWQIGVWRRTDKMKKV